MQKASATRRWLPALALALPLALAGTTGTGVAAASAAGDARGTAPGTDCPVPAGPRDAAVHPAAAAAPIKLWMAGDSTMATPAATCPAGWGSQFDPLFTDDVTVRQQRRGRPEHPDVALRPQRDKHEELGRRVRRQPADLLRRAGRPCSNATTGMKPGDYLLIQFGINDGTSTCPRHVGSARYRELLGDDGQAAKARGAHPIFLTPVAAITCSGSTAVGQPRLRHRDQRGRHRQRRTRHRPAPAQLHALQHACGSAPSTATTPRARSAPSSATTTPTSSRPAPGRSPAWWPRHCATSRSPSPPT